LPARRWASALWIMILGLLRFGDSRVGTARKPLRPKSVNHVAGTFCNPCLRLDLCDPDGNGSEVPCTAREENNVFALTPPSIAPKIDGTKSRVTLFPPLVRPVKTQLNRRFYEMARCGTWRGDAMGLSR
jgi:hypothetical protein